MSTKPWDIKKKDDRREDGLTVFIIYCEDSNSEPFYFRSLAQKGVKVNAIPNQQSGRLNLLNALIDCAKENKAVFSNNKFRIIEELTDLIWCVFDRDAEFESLDEIIPRDNLSFDLAIQTGSDANFNFAWSNDAFELWILLHFEDVSSDTWMHRNEIYQRLTNVFRTVLPRSPELDAITEHQYFNYRNSFKKKEHFVRHVLPLLNDRRYTAIQRAKALEEYFESKDTPFYRRNPCTQVHHLVEKIINSYETI